MSRRRFRRSRPQHLSAVGAWRATRPGEDKLWAKACRDLGIPRWALAADQASDGTKSLTDAQWAKMEPHCLGKPTDPGRSGSDNRRFIEAVLWIVRTGSPRRDLPTFFGNWNTVFKRYRDWVKADVFIRLFDACSEQPDMEYAMIDATIVKVHRHGQGAKGGRTTIRASGNSLRMAMIASMPLISGICRSIRVMSGWCRRNCSIASRPVEACATSSMSGSTSTSAAMPWRRSAWSSAVRIRIVFVSAFMDPHLSP